MREEKRLANLSAKFCRVCSSPEERMERKIPATLESRDEVG